MSFLSKSTIVLFSAIVLVSAGCGGTNYELAEVSGVVTLNDEPLEGLGVRFLPDSEAETSGPESFALTDAEGRYTLKVQTKDNKSGAVIGNHRVVIEDRMAENSRDEPMEPRISLKFMNSSQSPIKVEVKADGNTIDLELSEY